MNAFDNPIGMRMLRDHERHEFEMTFDNEVTTPTKMRAELCRIDRNDRARARVWL